jgi:thiosulfate/3-mercaptopyruvate sulfurtransferase
MTEVEVISNHGVRSGAVTWALRRLGYTKARNFAGGYEQVTFKRK